MRDIGHFIGGKAVKGISGRFGDIFDPNTGEVQARVALAKHSEVEHAIANAEAAQPAWGATNPQAGWAASALAMARRPSRPGERPIRSAAPA